MKAFAFLCLISFVLYEDVVAKSNTTWNHFMFVYQWPGTFCIRHRSFGVKCTIPKEVKYWTIHGLWPAVDSGHSPEHCTNQTFDENKIKTLLPELNQYWTDFLPYKTLWKHEWETHGTCATTVPATKTEQLYFQKSLDLYQKYRPNDVLNQCNIEPSDDLYFRVSDVRGCIEKLLGTRPQLYCYMNKKKEHQEIAEIRLCFTKSFNLEDCPEPGIPTTVDVLLPCSSKYGLYYPKIDYIAGLMLPNVIYVGESVPLASV